MGILTLKKRPLSREVSDYRDDRLFIVACDDTFAPKQYFDSFNIERIKFHVIPTEDGTSHAERVLERLLAFECRDDDERWMLLDTDHCIQGGHVKSFIRALKDAGNKGVKVALSRSCFEIWLLLHHLSEDDVRLLVNASEAEALLRKTLGSYSKTNLKGEDFPLSSVVLACQRAKRLDVSVAGTHIPKGVTSRVYQLWQSIVDGASPQQLPAELRALRTK